MGKVHQHFRRNYSTSDTKYKLADINIYNKQYIMFLL